MAITSFRPSHGSPIHFMFGTRVGFSRSADRMALTLGNRAMQRGSQDQSSRCIIWYNVWVSSVIDVLFGRKGNGLGIYLRMSVVVALGSLLVQVTHTESGPASEVGGRGHWTLGRTGGNQSKEWSGNRAARCVHMWVPLACMTRDNWACPRGMDKVYDLCEGQGHWLLVNITAAILKKSNCDISVADHPIPIYTVFGSRTGFSGSADRLALFPISPNSIGEGKTMREE